MKWTSVLFLLPMWTTAGALEVRLPEAQLAVVPAVRPAESGTAEVGLLIDQVGRVKKTVVIRTNFRPRIERAVREAARDWRFQAARRGCVSVPSSIAVQFAFDATNPSKPWSTAVITTLADPENRMPVWPADSAEIQDGREALKRLRDPNDAPAETEPFKPTTCVVKREKITYPMNARRAGQNGVVMTLALVAPDGSVVRTDTIQSFPRADFGVAAATAIRQYRFEPHPARLAQGEWVCIPVTFRLIDEYGDAGERNYKSPDCASESEE